MGTTFHPDPNAVNFRDNARKAIVDTTNATPINVKVTGHGYATGDSVQIENADDPNANGFWPITVVDADHFTLDGSVGTLVGGANGIAENWTLLPYATIPSDGDLVDATNANTPVERALNTDAWPGLASRWRVLDIYYNQLDDGRLANTTWSTNNTGGTAAWLWAQNAAGLFGYAGGASPVAGTTDHLLIQISTTYIQTAGAAIMALAIGVKDTTGGIYKVPGSQLRLPNNYNGPLVLTGEYRPQGANNTVGYFDMGIIYADDNAGQTFLLKSDWTIFVTHYRAQP